MRPFDDIARLERAKLLDRPGSAIRAVVHRLLDGKPIKDVLHGTWLGHPLHPAIVQFTLGSFMSASMIDLVRGERRYSTGLIAAGLALTPPTVAAGWADWSESNPDQQRVGLVHAATNVAAVGCYTAALVSRARGRGGRLWSIAGLAVSGVGAVLGGHLSFHQGLGVNHAGRERDLAPRDWQSLGRLAEVPEGTPVRRSAGPVDVVVLRQGTRVTVLSDRCPHLSAPLSDGQLVGSDGDARLVCPWHGSEFRLADGCVARGPATAAVPRFESRVDNGELQARITISAGAPTL